MYLYHESVLIGGRKLFSGDQPLIKGEIGRGLGSLTGINLLEKLESSLLLWTFQVRLMASSYKAFPSVKRV